MWTFWIMTISKQIKKKTFFKQKVTLIILCYSVLLITLYILFLMLWKLVKWRFINNRRGCYYNDDTLNLFAQVPVQLSDYLRPQTHSLCWSSFLNHCIKYQARLEPSVADIMRILKKNGVRNCFITNDTDYHLK